MSTRLVVNPQNELEEFRQPNFPLQPPFIRQAAQFLSYIFHPLFIPVYVAWFLVTIQPHLFASFSPMEKILTILRFFIMYSFFPLVTVLLAKALGFLQSIYLKTQKERIIPYIACGIYYFWMWYVLRNQPQFSREIIIFSMAIWIASSLGLLANIYMKVSMHALSMGVMLCFVLLLGFTQTGFGLYVSAALLISGLVCTARFIVSDHTPLEVYGGLVLGILAQLIAYWAWQ
ncbi:MAG TPA: hypothetical protein VFX58_20330 [Chitinophagaceae bacterium]|nr:hypothetical protein [Chitinophagaceae bacterium]